MSNGLVKFLCCLVAGLQMLASTAFAKGLTLCVPDDGSAHIEILAPHEDCSKGCHGFDAHLQPSIDREADGHGCVDIPLNGHAATTVKGAQHSVAQTSEANCFAILPLCLQLSPTPRSATAYARATADESRPPNAALALVGSVILIV